MCVLVLAIYRVGSDLFFDALNMLRYSIYKPFSLVFIFKIWWIIVGKSARALNKFRLKNVVFLFINFILWFVASPHWDWQNENSFMNGMNRWTLKTSYHFHFASKWENCLICWIHAFMPVVVQNTYSSSSYVLGCARYRLWLRLHTRVFGSGFIMSNGVIKCFWFNWWQSGRFQMMEMDSGT